MHWANFTTQFKILLLLVTKVGFHYCVLWGGGGGNLYYAHGWRKQNPGLRGFTAVDITGRTTLSSSEIQY